MHDPGIIIAPIFFLSLFGMIFGITYVRNRENMALIEKGINPRVARPMTPKPFLSLKFGLLLCGIGMGLLFAFLIDQTVLNHKMLRCDGTSYYKEFPQIYFSMITLFGGLGLVISYLIEKKDWLDKKVDEKETNVKYLQSEKMSL